MKLIYNVEDKPQVSERIVFAFQQLLAIMAATIAVPAIVGNGMTASAALFGAGVGTLVYQLFTKFRSPVFLGSSFAFLGSMFAAFAGGVSMSLGFLGLILGAVFAGLVYVIIALIIKKTGSEWVNKLLPPVVIGPTVALIGLSLCGSAVNNIANLNGDHSFVKLVEGFAGTITAENLAEATEIGFFSGYSLVHILVGIIAFVITVYASTKGSKGMKMIPFIIGILGAYVVALVFTFIGNAANIDALKLVNLAAFDNMQIFKVPRFTFLGIFGAYPDAANKIGSFADVISIFVLFAPVAFVTLAEHIADHKNLSSIIERDLITDPGLDRTLIGDGVGSIVGSFFGGCPNTTYGESVGCVAITGNASISTIAIAAVYCIILSFFDPFVCFVNSIPSCIVGGVCIALYGFIAVSGLKMLQPVDLNDNRNLFVVAAILVTGIGGLTLNFGAVTISSIATGLILGIIINVIFNKRAAK